MTESFFSLKPVEAIPQLKQKVYLALKEAVEEMDIYNGRGAPALDERMLAAELGVSRTPVREAITRLEQEGLVETVPRKGIYVVRKTKKEILEIIHVWAALEGMAARLATINASDEELRSMRTLFATFNEGEQASARIDEYSDTNITFHQQLIKLSKCELLINITDGLFIHMRAIRRKTISERNRTNESIIDHMRIIEALETRDSQKAESLVKEHAMYLGRHVDKYVDYLE